MRNWYGNWLGNRYGDRFRYRNTDRSRHRVRNRMRNWDRYRLLHCNRNGSIYRYRVGTGNRHRDRLRYRNRDMPLHRDWVGLRHRNGNWVGHSEIADATALTCCSSVEGSDGWTACRPKAQARPMSFSQEPALLVLLLFV
jgi:hypothetical protein